MQTVFGLRRLDRIRILVPCFRPLGLLGAFGGKAFSQDHPKGYLNLEFLMVFFQISKDFLECPEASHWSPFSDFLPRFL